MRLSRLAPLAFAAVSAAAGATFVDISSAGTQVLGPGDALHFLISNLSLQTVTGVCFQFVTLPLELGDAAQFEAELTSPDGSISAPFASLSVSNGQLQSARYSGAITSVAGSLQLTPKVSHDIFQDTRATLILHNTNGRVTAGVPGYTLPQDLFVSLAAGRGRSAGAVVSKVLYQDPPPADVPEPGSGLLFGVAGLLLCAFSGLLKRIHVRRI